MAFDPSWLERRDDPLRMVARGADGEPDVEPVWAALPPLVGPTFLGGRELAVKPQVEPDGRIAGLLEEPLEVAPGDLVAWGDTVPAAVMVAGRTPYGIQLQRSLLALPDPAGCAIWCLDSGPRTHCRVHRGGAWTDASPQAFDAAAETVLRQQAAELETAAEVNLPPLYRAAWRVSLLRGLNTFVGPQPKYGWGWYEGREHDSFPPVILSLGHALIDAGLLTTAQDLCGHWLATRITAAGEIDYYGPSLAEAGMLLDLAVRLARAGRDAPWWAAVQPPLRCLADRLVARFTVHGGPLPGIAEADDHADPAAARAIYYSNNLWAARGLLTLAHLLGEAGQDYATCGQRWRQETQLLLAADTVTAADGELRVAYVAGRHDWPAHLTASREGSYANYRCYPEMLSSRLLTPAQATAVFRQRQTCGGEFCGTTRFERQLDDWPAAEVGLAQLDFDCVEAVQRLLVGHLALHHALGHFTAYEQVAIVPGEDGLRRPVAGYCLPVQLVAPRLLRNLLVHEAADALWLNRAGFRRWLPDGYGVSGTATRWGRVAFGLQWDGSGLTGWIDATDLQREVPIRLRLRRPDGRPVERLEVNGRPVELHDQSAALPRELGQVQFRAS
ncbi:MAG: hypothetical protein IT204_13125 [Fimbriimonadaceae bacterium]|nr:hypothetical protein [Fimbriimonadaceae bacterium]